MALFIWGFLVNRKRAWRTDGGTGAFGAGAMSLAITSTAVNFVEVREDNLSWLQNLTWALVLWQSWLGFWWWVGSGMGIGEVQVRSEVQRFWVVAYLFAGYHGEGRTQESSTREERTQTTSRRRRTTEPISPRRRNRDSNLQRPRRTRSRNTREHYPTDHKPCPTSRGASSSRRDRDAAHLFKRTRSRATGPARTKPRPPRPSSQNIHHGIHILRCIAAST
jgi:hypothetical protein